jgi:glycosyltransferase involved in cell wall biosynthesis
MTAPQIAIMLCTYNGASYLDEQLRSISRQTLADFIVIASDDGSTDATLAILEQAAATHLSGRLRIVEGPHTGVNANFLSVTAFAEPPAPFIAYADQDDIWDDDKLERAMAWLSGIEPSRPALYGTRTRLIDQHGADIGHSPHFTRPAGFANALVQNMFGGNTMVFNAAAWHALKQSNPANVVSHDWWTYIVVTAMGGAVRYEAEPSLSYRQHANNLVGANTSWTARLHRVRMLNEGRFAQWNATNAAALAPLLSAMPAETRQVFDRFQNARVKAFPANLVWLVRSGVYRQTWLSDLGLWLATVTRRI